MTVEVFRDTRAILVESIWWDARHDEVVWVDISAGLLHRGPLDGAADGSDDRVVELPPPLSAVQPADDGGYIAALGDRVVLLDADGRIRSTLADVPHRHGGIRLNEGKNDPFGCFVVGSMELTSDDPDAALYRVDAAGSLRTLRGGYGVANGVEWLDGGATMLVTDTSASTVYRGSYGPDGALGELEPFLTGHPSDGLARAADGSFWNGSYGGGELLRWGADGDLAGRIPLPVPNVTSVAFVGPGLDVLLVGSARENLTEDDLVRHPLSGGILRIEGVGSGFPPHLFRTADGGPIRSARQTGDL